MIEAARSAKSLCEMLDEGSDVGGMNFNDVTSELDMKLKDMNLHTMARRLRDVCKIAEGRYGMLLVVCDDLTSANATLHSEISYLRGSSSPFETTAIETLVIGNRPSREEMEEYQAADGKFNRFDLAYLDLGDEWDITDLANRTVLRQRVNSDSEDEASDNPSNSTNGVLARRTRARNRSAQVVPVSVSDALFN
jgi:hypothetical protein